MIGSLQEMKYAENASSVEPTCWDLDVYSDLAQVLLDVVQLGDYIIIWGGNMDSTGAKVVLNGENSSPCYIAIYRHDVRFILKN